MAKKIKVNHDYKCKCGKPATRCQQQVWMEYSILDNGDFDSGEELDSSGDAEYFCDNCNP